MQPVEWTRRRFTQTAAIAALGLSAGVQAETEVPGMKIAVLGDSVCIPDPGHEPSSLLVNGKHLIDTGWCVALSMRQYGFDPTVLESILLTHCHQDHYIGLPQLLFFIGMKQSQRPLTIAGPAEHLAHVLEAARDFLQIHRFPELAVNVKAVPLAPGDVLELSDVRVESLAARHVSSKNRAEPALAYRVTDKASGATFAYSGDTSYHPPLAEFARNVPLLIHDAAHTSAKDAADIARQAGAGRLLLIHYAQSRGQRLLQEAQGVFPNTDLARQGETLEIAAAGGGR